MNIQFMPDDMIIELFSLLKPDNNLFLISKRIYELRNKFITVSMTKLHIPVKLTRTPVIDSLLYYYGYINRTIYNYDSKGGDIVSQQHWRPYWSHLSRRLKPEIRIREKNYHILYIMSFISDKTRTETIYTCKNSYKRYIAHQFCEKMNLNHETIYKEYHFKDDHGIEYTNNIKVIKITKKI